VAPDLTSEIDLEQHAIVGVANRDRGSMSDPRRRHQQRSRHRLRPSDRGLVFVGEGAATGYIASSFPAARRSCGCNGQITVPAALRSLLGSQPSRSIVNGNGT
jgi:hypothetical protein